MIDNKRVKQFHFPTALGLFFILLIIGGAIFWAKTRSGVKPSSDAASSPEQVRITNVSDTGFSVSWITEKTDTGSIKLGTLATELKQSVLDDRDQLSGGAAVAEVHHVTAKNLTPQTKYYFKIDSGGKQYDNKGKPFEVTTGATLGSPPAADPIYGTILTQSGTVAENVVVYINVANGAPLSALVKSQGSWALSLATARTADLASYLTYDTQVTIVNLLVQGGKQGTASAITTTANDNPVPDITLGKSADFRVAAGPLNTSPPSGEASASGQTASGSGETAAKTGFDALNPTIAEAGIETGEVTLDNPSFEGEVINATQPAFMGTGPIGVVLAIEINSDEPFTGSATIDEDGNWEFTPPSGLAPGEHSVTISYIDTQGEEQTLSRNFVIAAAGQSDAPAITATQSGKEASPAPRTSMPATDSGVPSPGTFEITLLMILTGLGLLIGGWRLKNSV